MAQKKSFLDLTSMVITIAIITAITLLIINKLYLQKPLYQNHSPVNPSSDEQDAKQYPSILKRSQQAAESLQNKLENEQEAINRWP